ncbi:MAG TPA: hypothetical protein VIL28_09645 [Steroidobacteraceae bacterium]
MAVAISTHKRRAIIAKRKRISTASRRFFLQKTLSKFLEKFFSLESAFRALVALTLMSTLLRLKAGQSSAHDRLDATTYRARMRSPRMETVLGD